MPTPRPLADNDHTVQLGDGRTIGYAEWGAPDGSPVLDLHGIPASRLQGGYVDATAKARGIRLLSIDRPGIGLSGRRPGHRVADWPEDVAAVADALLLDRFGVLGWSGGGPYALACAWKLAERLTAVGNVAGLGPCETKAARAELGATDRLLFGACERVPFLARAGLSFAARQKPARALDRFKGELSETDRDVIDAIAAEQGDATMAFFLEAMRDGPQGLVDDYRALGAPWGFTAGEIAAPVNFWHGTDDRSVPIATSRALVATMPHATLTEFPGKGHMIYITHADEILAPFVAR